jgi:hypothetical protein
VEQDLEKARYYYSMSAAVNADARGLLEAIEEKIANPGAKVSEGNGNGGTGVGNDGVVHSQLPEGATKEYTTAATSSTSSTTATTTQQESKKSGGGLVSSVKKMFGF